MIRKLLFAAAIALAPISVSANPDQIRESIVMQLRSQGFTRITVSRTLLGRARVVAQSPTLNREIIFNPVTGEIIRDYWRKRLGGQTGATIVNPNQGMGEEGQGAQGNDGIGGDEGGDDGGGDDSDGGDGGDEGGGDSDSGDGGDEGGDDSDGGDGGDEGGDDD